MPAGRDWGCADAERRPARRAYATLGHDPGAVMLDAAALQMTERIAHFRPQARSLPRIDLLFWPANLALPSLGKLPRQGTSCTQHSQTRRGVRIQQRRTTLPPSLHRLAD